MGFEDTNPPFLLGTQTDPGKSMSLIRLFFTIIILFNNHLNPESFGNSSLR